MQTKRESSSSSNTDQRSVRRKIANFVEEITLESEQELDKAKALHALVVDELRAVSRQLEDANDQIDSQQADLWEAARTIESHECKINSQQADLCEAARIVESDQRRIGSLIKTIEEMVDTFKRMQQESILAIQARDQQLAAMKALAADLETKVGTCQEEIRLLSIETGRFHLAQGHFVDCITLEITATCVPTTSGQVGTPVIYQA